VIRDTTRNSTMLLAPRALFWGHRLGYPEYNQTSIHLDADDHRLIWVFYNPTLRGGGNNGNTNEKKMLNEG
jgi:hypothetical protein